MLVGSHMIYVAAYCSGISLTHREYCINHKCNGFVLLCIVINVPYSLGSFDLFSSLYIKQALVYEIQLRLHAYYIILISESKSIR